MGGRRTAAHHRGALRGGRGPRWSTPRLSSALSPLAYLGNLEHLASWISLHSRGSDRCHHRPPRKLCSWVHTLLRLLLRPSGEAPTPHSGQGPRAPPKCQAPLCSLTCHQVGSFLWWDLSTAQAPRGGPSGQNQTQGRMGSLLAAKSRDRTTFSYGMWVTKETVFTSWPSLIGWLMRISHH